MIRALPMVQEVCRSLNWATPTTIDGTTNERVLKVLQAINYVGQRLGKFSRWRFLYKRHYLRMIPHYSTGTVSITQGETTATFTDAVLTQDMVGRTFKATPYPELYKIIEVDGSTVTFDQPYNGDTIADKTYRIVKDRYPMPEDYDSAELSMVEMITPKELDLVSPDQFDRMKFTIYPPGYDLLQTGKPEVATIRGIEDDVYVLEVMPAPDKYMQLIFSYYAMISKFEADDDMWPFPPYWESVIHDGAMKYLQMNAKDDVRAASAMQDFFNGREELTTTEPMDTRAQMFPETGEYRRSRRWRRARASDIDWGSAFDRGRAGRR